jgi:predicted  nucleic acid-binding Zn-ribbon protein
METTRQLYQLQEIDIEIEQAEQSLAEKNAQLGNRDTLNMAMQKFTAGQKHLDDLKHQRRDVEGQMNDILSKIKDAEKQLYGGKVTNPKELANLQHEINNLKSQNDTIENKALSIIDQVEAAEKSVAAVNSEYKAIEEAWQRRQKQLAVEVEELKAKLTELKPERAQMAGQIEAPVLALYHKLRLQKKTALARVEQGICRSCRISLSASAFQRARNGQPVQCSTCGRILYIP